MADGAATASRRGVTRRFRTVAERDAAESEEGLQARELKVDGHHGGGKKRPRIAFTGEEFGFGYQAVTRFVDNARKSGAYVSDGGFSVVPKTANIKDITARETKRDRFEFRHDSEIRQPLRTREQALIAVNSGTADFAVVPFYNPFFGYDFETLRAMANIFGMLAVEQVDATDQLCLAVHESQVLELAQSSHPASGFSALLKGNVSSWASSGEANEEGRRKYPDFHGNSNNFRAGLNIDRAAQMLLRDRIDMVFAGPEAARRCKSKLDGLRAAGVDIQETPQSVEPHREMARRARASLTSQRMVNTYFDPKKGDVHYVSSLNSDSQQSRLFGVVLPFQVADMSSEYIIVDDNLEDAEPAKTRFFVVRRDSLDETLIEDAYKTTDARTRYWEKRLAAVSHGSDVDKLNPVSTLPTLLQPLFGLAFLASAVAVFAGGLDVATAWLSSTFGILSATNLTASIPYVSSYVTAQGFFGLGAVALALSWFLLSMRKSGGRGVRIMFRMQRAGEAASLGDIQDYLRNFGVRHAVVRLDEDSEKDAPAAVVLDVELEPGDFAYSPWTMLNKRLRGSIANGALKKIFNRWKSRSVTVLAAMPYEKAQMPKHHRRSWWNDAARAWVEDFVETMVIRAQRVLLPILIVAFAVLVWYTYFRG